jgi:hypothetical protein
MNPACPPKHSEGGFPLLEKASVKPEAFLLPLIMIELAGREACPERSATEAKGVQPALRNTVKGGSRY